MSKYTAWIEQSNGTVRIIEVEADGIRKAYRQAEAQCDGGEFVRGVNQLDEEA